MICAIFWDEKSHDVLLCVKKKIKIFELLILPGSAISPPPRGCVVYQYIPH